MKTSLISKHEKHQTQQEILLEMHKKQQNLDITPESESDVKNHKNQNNDVMCLDLECNRERIELLQCLFDVTMMGYECCDNALCLVLSELLPSKTHE